MGRKIIYIATCKKIINLTNNMKNAKIMASARIRRSNLLDFYRELVFGEN